MPWSWPTLATASRSVISSAGLETVSQNRARVLSSMARAKFCRVVGIDELHGDAERRQDVVELGVGAAVEVAGRDDVVAGLGEVDDRVEDAAGARGHAQAAQLGAPSSRATRFSSTSVVGFMSRV